MQELISGLKYAFKGFELVLKPGIRKYVLVPFFINIVLFTFVIIYGTHLLNEFIETFLTGWWEWIRWLLWPIFILVVLAIVFFCFSIIANLLAAPFNGFLAAATETRITGVQHRDDGGLGQIPGEIKKAIVSESGKFIYFIIRVIPLIFLFFIPFLNFAAPILWFMFGAWMLALEYIDFPMGNHGITFPEIRNILKNRRPLAFGFGIGVMILTLIPIINFIALPVAVCGATLMWVEKLRTG